MVIDLLGYGYDNTGDPSHSVRVETYLLANKK